MKPVLEPLPMWPTAVARMAVVLLSDGSIGTAVLLDGLDDDRKWCTIRRTLDEETGEYVEPITVEMTGRATEPDHMATSLMRRMAWAMLREADRVDHARSRRGPWVK